MVIKHVSETDSKEIRNKVITSFSHVKVSVNQRKGDRWADNQVVRAKPGRNLKASLRKTEHELNSLSLNQKNKLMMLKSQKLLRKLYMMQFVFKQLNKSVTEGNRQENSMRDVDRNEETLKEKDRDKTEGGTHWKGKLTKFKVISRAKNRWHKQKG